MGSKLYLLTMDGEYKNDRGADIYLVGVFTKAEFAVEARDAAIEKNTDLEVDAFTITPINVNSPLTVKAFLQGWETIINLGGYCE